MPKTYDTDWGPRGDENALRQGIRKAMGTYTNQMFVGMNVAIDVKVLDYITQYAATSAINNYDAQINNTARTNSESWARYWIAGYLDWYRTATPATRDDVGSQLRFADIAYRGALIVMRNRYPRIPWTLELVMRVDGPLMSASISERALDRINDNLVFSTVNTWKVTPLRSGARCYLPSECKSGNTTIELGDEILSDWIDPVDANHGHPLQTLCKAYEAISPKNTQKDGDKLKCEVLLPGGYWRIVWKEKTPPCVVTFFRRTRV